MDKKINPSDTPAPTSTDDAKELTTEGVTDAARDIKFLIAQIDYLQEAFGEELCEEDAGIVMQIRDTWSAQASEGQNNG